MLKAFAILGFGLVREGSHLALERGSEDGSKTPLTLPNHRLIKGSPLRTILTPSGITREEFLAALDAA